MRPSPHGSGTDGHLDPLELLQVGVAGRRHGPPERADEVHRAVGDAGGAVQDLLQTPDGAHVDPLAAGDLGVVGFRAPVVAATGGLGGAGEGSPS